MEIENKKEMGVADGKDLEWKFDVDSTQVTCFEELIGLIVMLHVIQNLNSQLDKKEQKFVKRVFDEFCYDKTVSNVPEIIASCKKNTSSPTRDIYDKALRVIWEGPFPTLLMCNEKLCFYVV